MVILFFYSLSRFSIPEQNWTYRGTLQRSEEHRGNNPAKHLPHILDNCFTKMFIFINWDTPANMKPQETTMKT